MELIMRTANEVKPWERSVVIPHLHDLFIPGPVERGLYVASQSHDLIPQVLDGLVSLLWNEQIQQPLQAEIENKPWRRPSRIAARRRSPGTFVRPPSQ